MAFYNCHIHVFSAQCAPRNFLEVGLPAYLDPLAGGIRSLLETRMIRYVVQRLSKSKATWGPLKVASRYASFASVGIMSTQKMVFENILPHYPVGTRFVVLTLNMDYMGAGESELTYQGQIDEVIHLRRLYPDTCLPFLSVDPRMGNEDELETFVKTYIGPGKPFIGVKLYPALGYFPFDQRLSKVYAFCEKNGVPIMTHCTPSGAFFLGKLTTTMAYPKTIDYVAEKDGETIRRPPPIPLPAPFCLKNNSDDCDLFLRPENWDTVLATYPKLKVCFAHMGGTTEIFYTPTEKRQHSWFEDVQALMAAYEGVFTDISYTLADKRTWETIATLLDKTPAIQRPWPHLPGNTTAFADTIKDRILFGTDYFMTEQEDTEENLASKLPEWLLRHKGRAVFERLVEANPKNYLQSSFYSP